MSHTWLIESLADLRAYAARNNMPALAEHLETAIQLAHLELANKAANDTHAPTKDHRPDPEKHRHKDHGPKDHGLKDDNIEIEEPEKPDPENPPPKKPGPKNRSP